MLYDVITDVEDKNGKTLQQLLCTTTKC